MKSGQFVGGPQVAALEEAFAQYCGAAHATATNSGTSAIHLALLAAGVGPGHEVITAPNTFVATVEPICYCGATPVFADIDPVSFTLNPGRVESAVTERTKAILAVHLHGHPADMDPLAGIARRRGLALVEDAAQAHGARYKGRMAGALGDLACFSFHPAKNLPAIGNGGMVLASDEEGHAACQILRNHGRRTWDMAEVVGYNYRMDAIQAAVLNLRLPELDASNARRRAHAERYFERLAELPLRLPRESGDVEHVFNVFSICTGRRDALRRFLDERGIRTDVFYPVPIHLHRAYEHLGYAEGDFPEAEAYCRETLALPMAPDLTDDDIDDVCDAITLFVEQADGASS